MIVVRPGGAIERIERIAFAEPKQYAPRESWYRQFDGRVLDQDLRLKRGIRGITGATLSARATAAFARRVLAVHGVVAARPSPDAPDPKTESSPESKAEPKTKPAGKSGETPAKEPAKEPAKKAAGRTGTGR